MTIIEGWDGVGVCVEILLMIHWWLFQVTVILQCLLTHLFMCMELKIMSWERGYLAVSDTYDVVLVTALHG